MCLAVFLVCVALLYIVGLLLAPFPYWPTYFVLWRAVLFGPGDRLAKRRQAAFLLRVGAAAPVWTLLWYLDEILYPAYRKQVIDPVFIIGQARCGSTLLHRTLATDEQTFFAVRHIEWRYPFILVQRLIGFLGLDNRLRNANYWPDSKVGKLAAKMHPNTLADWEEDGIFFEENYLHHLFIFLRFPYPELLPYLDGFPELPERAQQKMLRNHEKVLQKVHYLRGPPTRRYLSKEVAGHTKIPALIRQYPQARFIVITRSANNFMASLMALLRASTESKTGVDPKTIPDWEETMVRRMREDCRRLVALCQETIPLDRQVRVSATHFIANIHASVVEVYRELGLRVCDDFAAYLRRQQEGQNERQRGYDYASLVLQGFEEYDVFVRGIEAQSAPGWDAGTDTGTSLRSLPQTVDNSSRSLANPAGAAQGRDESRATRLQP